MKVEQINEIDGEVELRITASVPEVEKAFEDGLQLFITQYEIEGSEDEAPVQRIYKSLGNEEGRDAITSAVISFLLPFALEREEIIPMTSSNVNAESDPKQGEEFTFSVTVLPKPEFELTDYSPVEVSVPARTDVTESDIDMQVHMLAHEFATIKVDPETGEEEIIEPEVTDEWIKNTLQGTGVESVEQLRSQFRETSERVKNEQFENSKMSAIMAEYAKRFTGEISEKMTAAMTDDMYEAFKTEIANEGMTLMDFMLQQKTDEKQIRASLATQAENQLIQGFVLDAIFRHHKLKLELADLMSALGSLAPGDEEDAFETMQKTGRVFLLKEGASRMKAANWLMENSKINIIE